MGPSPLRGHGRSWDSCPLVRGPGHRLLRRDLTQGSEVRGRKRGSWAMVWEDRVSDGRGSKAEAPSSSPSSWRATVSGDTASGDTASGDTASSRSQPRCPERARPSSLHGQQPQPCPQVQPQGSKLASPQVRGARAAPGPSAAQRRVRPPLPSGLAPALSGVGCPSWTRCLTLAARQGLIPQETLSHFSQNPAQTVKQSKDQLQPGVGACRSFGRHRWADVQTGTSPLSGEGGVPRPEPQAEAPSWPKHRGWCGQASLRLVSAAQVLRPSTGWEPGDTSLARVQARAAGPHFWPSLLPAPWTRGFLWAQLGALAPGGPAAMPEPAGETPSTQGRPAR